MSGFAPLLFMVGISLFPGLAILRRMKTLPRDWLLRAGLVAGTGLSVTLWVTLACMWLQVSVPHLAWILMGVAALSLPLCCWPISKPKAVSSSGSRGIFLGIFTVVFLSFCGWYQGGAFDIGGDGPELLAALREMITSGEFFPRETHFLNADLAGMDIRKGLLHPLYAAGFQFYSQNLLQTWLRLPLIFTALPLLSSYAAIRLAGFGRGPAFLAGWLLVLTMNGGLTGGFAPMTSNPKVVATCLFWLSCGISVYAGKRSSPWTAVLAGMVGAAAGLAHPMVLVFLAAFYGCYLLWVLAGRRKRTNLAWSILVLAVGLLPYVWMRYQSYDPQNPLHRELQGMLFLGDVRVYSPMVWLSSAGWLAVPSYLGFLIVKWRKWDNLLIWWGWLAIVAMLMLAFNPLLVPLAQKTITYLVFRLPWMFPGAFAAAVLLAGLGPSKKRTLLVVAMGLFLLPNLFGLVRGDLLPRSGDSPLELTQRAELFASLNTIVPARSVLVADPTTSYLIPALTTHKVICTFDQHGTPNDSRALERITIAREILSPLLSPARAWELARREGAQYVLLWKKAIPVLSMYWQADPAAVVTRIAQLEKSPYFEMVPTHSQFALFALVDNPPPDRAPIPEFVGSTPSLPALLDSHGLRAWSPGVEPTRTTPGDTLLIPFTWTKTPQYTPAPLRLAVRFISMELPGGEIPGGKLWRKFLELVRGEEYQTRAVVAPGGGTAPPSIWSFREPVKQRVPLVVPKNMRPGGYVLEATLLRMPAIPNYHAQDIFQNRDLFSGAVFDTIWVDPLVKH